MPSSDEHVVKKGETIAKISKKLEIDDWKKLWKHKDNKELFEKYYGDASQICPKDVLFIPAELCSNPNALKVNVAGKMYEFKNERDRDDFVKTVKILKVNGKNNAFVRNEWEDFKKEMCATLKKTAVRARARADTAANILSTFVKLNSEETLVAWVVSWQAPKMPDQSTINAAKKAAENLGKAVESQDFKKIEAALEASEKAVNRAYTEAMEYQDGVIRTTTKQLAILEFTSTSAFMIVGVAAAPIAGAALGSAALGTAVAGGSAAFVKTSSTEFGRYLAGTSGGGGEAAYNIIVDTAIEALVGGFLKTSKGKDLIEGIGNRIARYVGSRLQFSISSRAVRKFTVVYITNGGKSAVEAAIKEGAKVLTGRTTPAEFMDRVAEAFILGGTFKFFDKPIKEVYAKEIYISIPRNARAALFARFPDAKTPLKVIEEVMKKTPNVALALEQALEKFNGAQKPEQLINDAATNLVADPKFLELLKTAAEAQ